MTLVLAAAILGLALYLAVRYAVDKGPLTLRVAILTGPEAATKPSKAPAPMPKSVAEFCAGESSPWAREALLAEANQLYGELEDWDAVLQTLTIRYDVHGSST